MTLSPDGASAGDASPASRAHRPAWVDGLLLAVGTLTAVPVPPPSRIDRLVAGRAMTWAPVTTVPGLVVLAVAEAVAMFSGMATLLLGALAIAVLTLLNRGMHLDGLADTADGLASGYDRDRALEVMRRSDIGPAGVAAVALALLVQVSALSVLFTSIAGGVLACLCLLASRQLLAWACLPDVPAARPEGLGATVADSVGVMSAGAGLLVVTLLGVGGMLLSGAQTLWWLPVPTVAVGILAGSVVTRRAVRRLGGITGDVLGAIVEIGFTAVLAAAAILVGILSV